MLADMKFAREIADRQTAEVCAARSDGRITPSEDARLRKIARRMIASAQAMADEI